MDPNDTQAAGTPEPVQDTSAAQSGATGEVANNEAPEATQAPAVEETAPTEVNAEDTADKLFAGKYKTVEEMERAYTELQSKATKDNQEKAELAKVLNEVFAQPDTQEPQADTFDVADPVSSEISNLKRLTTVQSFIMTHPQADASAMKEVLDTDPLVKEINSYEAKLEYAYMKSQSMGSKKTIDQARKEAATQAVAKVAEKQAAQVESGAKAAPIDEKAELVEKATGNYSYQEREAARLALLKKRFANL